MPPSHCKVYEANGAAIKEISLPHSPYAVAVYYLVATAEASSNLARYDGVHFGHRAEKFAGLIDMVKKSRGEGFGAEVKRRIMLGTYALSSGYIDAYYLKALKVRRLIRQDFDQAFAQCDVIIEPDFADHNVQDRREVERPVSDVSFRHLHDQRESGGHLQRQHSLRLHAGGAADRLADFGRSVRGGEDAACRAGCTSAGQNGIGGERRCRIGTGGIGYGNLAETKTAVRRNADNARILRRSERRNIARRC